MHFPADVQVTDLPLAGLPAPSLIRTAKIATIDAADATGSAACRNPG